MPSDMGSSSNYSYRDNPLMPSRILIVFDATKDRSYYEFRHTIHNIRMRGGIVHPGDTITVFGVLHRVLHPMGYHMGVAPENFLGATHFRAIEEEVSQKVDMYVSMLQCTAEECEGEGLNIEVKITAGTPVRKVVVQEVATSNASWVILDRHLKRELRHYLKYIPCKVALVLHNFSLEILRHDHFNIEIDHNDEKQFYSLSKIVPLPPVSDNDSNEQSVITLSYHGSMASMKSSDMSKSSLLSLFTSNSREHSFGSKIILG